MPGPFRHVRLRAVFGSLLAVLLGTAACRAALPIAYQVEPEPSVIGCRSTGCAPARDQVEITYLGSGGFQISYKNAVLLTAPFFTNPPLSRVAPKPLFILRRNGDKLSPDSSLIERLLPESADPTTMIVVGHSHYDHLMDVPYILRRRTKSAFVYGSPTMRHMLMGDPALRAQPERVVAITGAEVGSADSEGKWFYNTDSTFRIMALVADHAPTFKIGPLKASFAKGVLQHDLPTLPQRANAWLAGEPLSYLIDVLEPGHASPRLRIYYQDAPNTAPLGFPPLAVLAERAVDVALLCAATSNNVKDAPGRLLKLLQPSFVVAGHWEDFFRTQILPLKVNVATDADQFINALANALPKTSTWQMPMPRTTMRIDLRPPE